VQLSFSGHPPYTPSTVYTELAVTLACSLILTDWTTATQCCTVLQPAALRFYSECKTMQPGSFSKLQDDLMPSHYCVSCINWLPIQHRIEYKVAVLTFKSRSSATALTYLSRHIKARVSERTLRSSAVPLLDKPFTRTDFARRAFRCSAPTVWNSLHETVISADSLSVCKSRLKTYFF